MGSLTKKPKPFQTSNVPTWMQQAGEETFNRAKDVADQPYQPYGGQRVAGYGQNLQAAGDAAQASRGGVFRSDYFDPARSLISGNKYDARAISARDVTPGSVSAEKVGTERFGGRAAQRYMSPFIQQALSPVVRELGERGGRELSGIKQMAGARGAFGGSRQGLLESESMRGTKESISDALSGGYQQAYDRATGMFTSDQARALQAQQSNQATGLQAGQGNQATNLRAALANQAKDLDVGRFNESQRAQQSALATGQAQALGGLGTQFGNIKSGVVDRLMRTGGAEQAYSQSQADEDYRQFEEQRGHPQQQLEILMRALGMSPERIQASSGGSSPFSQLAGAGATAAAVYMSDTRSKEDIDLVDTIEGVKFYSFRYKNDPNKIKHTGVMAQEIREKIPNAVIAGEDGMLMVDYTQVNSYIRGKRCLH